MLPSIGIINIGVVESQKLLVIVAEGENSLFVVNYETCKDLVRIDDLINPAMF
jgi:hypothetical protein